MRSGEQILNDPYIQTKNFLYYIRRDKYEFLVIKSILKKNFFFAIVQFFFIISSPKTLTIPAKVSRLLTRRKKSKPTKSPKNLRK